MPIHAFSIKLNGNTRISVYMYAKFETHSRNCVIEAHSIQHEGVFMVAANHGCCMVLEMERSHPCLQGGVAFSKTFL